MNAEPSTPAPAAGAGPPPVPAGAIPSSGTPQGPLAPNSPAQPPPPPPPPPPVRVAALADLHVHKTHAGQYKPLFAEIAQRADVLCLCGDLTDVGLPEEAENLAGDLAALRIPVLAVLGNHDHHAGKAAEVRDALRRVKVIFLDEETFVHGGVGFAGVKGFGGGFDRAMLSAFGEDAVKSFVTEAINECLLLENALQRLTTDRAVVLLHYAPVMATVEGEPPEIHPFLGCSRLAETIDRFAAVRAVFHGHAHHGRPRGATARGVPVHNVAMQVGQHAGGPGYIVVEV